MVNFSEILQNEDGLDPENWQKHKEIAHQMIDDVFLYLSTVSDQPVWKKPPQSVKSFCSQPLPIDGEDIKCIYAELLENVLPYRTGNIHPRFFSWVHGTGTITGVLGDMLASAMNSNLAIGDHGAIYMEHNVLNWCKEMVGFPESSSGALVSGGSIANTTALIVARDSTIEKKKLLTGSKLIIYCSTETHSCICKTVKAMGLDVNNIRHIPVNEYFEINLSLLKEQITSDKKYGLLPFCVVANAGTVNTGAIDPFFELHLICKAENMWLHVDGAIGAVVKLVPEYENKMRGMELADSIAFDLHKWLHINYEAGCVLVRDAEAHRKAFAQPANYLFKHERGLAAGPDSFTNYSLDLSKSFKSLKIWMNLKEHGIDKYVKLMRQNIAHAFFLKDKINKNPSLQLLAPVSLNIVCYRYYSNELSEEQLNEINMEILMRMQERAIAAPSYTILNSRYAIRICINNHRTRVSDLIAVLEATENIGNEIFIQ